MQENTTTHEETKTQKQSWVAFANQKYIFFIKETKTHAFKLDDLNKATLNTDAGVEEMAQNISLEFMYPMESTVVNIFGTNLEDLFRRILTFEGNGLQIEESSDMCKIDLINYASSDYDRD